MKSVRRIICFILILGSLLCLPAKPAKAAEAVSGTEKLCSLTKGFELATPPAIESDYAILIEAKSGTVLYEKNAYEAAYPASITKIMTALLTVENTSPDDILTFSFRATHELDPGSSTIARTENEQMSIRDCLYALLVASANEVAQALAEQVSGSFESFAAKMTLRAYELGCVNTSFSNPSGLHSADHYTCAHDMALIMRAAYRNDLLREIMGTTSYQIAPTNKHSEITYLNSHHPLLTNQTGHFYEYAAAGKTGYTSDAMNTLVTYAVKGDMDLICVVMHANGTAATGADSKALFEYGFSNFVRCHVSAASDNQTEGSADGFLEGNILRFSDSGASYITLPKGLSLSDLSTEILYGGGPEGSNIAAVRIYRYGENEVGRIRLAVDPFSPHMPISGEISVAPTTRDILRAKHLGLPLIYWILIAGGVVLLGLLVLITLLIIKGIKKHRQRKESAARSMSNFESM